MRGGRRALPFSFQRRRCQLPCTALSAALQSLPRIYPHQNCERISEIVRGSSIFRHIPHYLSLLPFAFSLMHIVRLIGNPIHRRDETKAEDCATRCSRCLFHWNKGLFNVIMSSLPTVPPFEQKSAESSSRWPRLNLI